MIETMIDTKTREILNKEYPHVKYPSGLYARITKVSGSHYNLKILDENKIIDERYPEIPRVWSDKRFNVDDTVAVILMYGKLSHLYILGVV